MDAPIRTLIVDDEPTAQEVLARYVERHATLEAVGTCESAIEAANALREKDIDLLLLDVEMPEMSGLELVRAVEDPPAVILVTASETYAVEAFGIGVVDYLVKPVRYARFLKAISRVENQYLQRQPGGPAGSSPDSSSSPEESSQGGSPQEGSSQERSSQEGFPRERSPSEESPGQPGPGTLFFREGENLIQIRLEEVRYVEAEGDYMLIQTESGQHMVNTTMTKIEEKFPAGQFARVHRSYLVRLDQIEKIENDTLLIGETRVPIGPTYKERLLEKIQTL